MPCEYFIVYSRTELAIWLAAFFLQLSRYLLLLSNNLPELLIIKNEILRPLVHGIGYQDEHKKSAGIWLHQGRLI